MKRTIRDLDVRGKRVLLRVDFNVPLDENGTITDDTRILKALPTIKYLLSKGARIICSHLGRPKGEKIQKFSLYPVAQRMIDLLLNRGFIFQKKLWVRKPEAKAKALTDGQVLILENLRFYKEEEQNDPCVCKKACFTC